MKELNPLTLPLNQNALIEASAGTGKTYTITTLYLRAVLGLRNTDMSLTPLSIDQILVVTFTEAATQELRDRIRNKLKEAQKALLATLSEQANLVIDKTLKSVISDYSEAYKAHNLQATNQDTILAAYHRIQDAITLIDEAAIFTIHGFCQRCLNQFAFETKMAFEQSFEMDNQPYIKQALYDFWRQYVLDLTGVEYKLFRKAWANPNQLLASLNDILNKQVVIEPSIEQAEYTSLIKRYGDALESLKVKLRTSDFISTIRESGVNGKKPLLTKLSLIEGFIEPTNNSEMLSLDEIAIFTTSNVSDASNYKKNYAPVSHPVTHAFDDLHAIAAQLLDSQFEGYWLTTAKEKIEEGALGIKADQQLLTPDDLLLQLRSALFNQEGAEGLIESIQTRYPLAFIDEFQDTDPVQYEIFSCIYNATIDDETDSVNMIMIGDPKQAIYRFRGADIFTYITAKGHLDHEQHYTLSTNWRSHQDLITGINHIFETSPLKFEHEQIPFISVGSGKLDSPELIQHEKTLPKLEVLHFSALDQDPPLNGFSLPEIQKVIARQCAMEIANLLRDSENGAAFLESPSVTPKSVSANDIAILVRNRNQAKLLKRTLIELGVRSVYINRDSVFRSALAKDMLRLIEAIHSPINERKVKAAVATDFFAYSLLELSALQQNPKAWHQHLVCFHQAHQYWSQGKISSAIDQVLAFANTFEAWQNQGIDFERQVTDYRHLLELIQQESVIQNGAEKLMAWLRQAVIENTVDSSDDVSMRLESDSNLVQIVTMHGSKGLEYPIVYIPFATEFKAQKIALHQSKRLNALSLRVDKRKIEMQIAEGERLAEDIRLLYVAMTRAKQRLVLGCFNLKERSNSKDSSVDKSAFGRLILGKDKPKISETDWQSALTSKIESLAEPIAKLSIIAPQTVNANFNGVKDEFVEYQSKHASSDKKETYSCAEFEGQIPQNWRVLSYSALVGAGEHFIPGASDEMTHLGIFDAAQTNSFETLTPDNDEGDSFPDNNPLDVRFTFPKGANPGSCLHHMFEHLDFTQPVTDQTEIVLDALQRFGLDEHLLDDAILWLNDVMRADLGQWSLSDIKHEQRLDEMEFYFNVQSLNSEIIGNALSMCGFDKTKINTSVLNLKGLTGLLKGFIDLTACVNGQYYIIDYKSNYLGNRFEDYQSDNIFDAMTDHNYHLQLIIYSYALHKWLSLKLADYRYDEHVAGGMYLFLRGMSQTHRGKGVYSYKVPYEVIQYFDNALLEGGE
ncbi:exodeoxyribonuclease V subunit beta [Psychrosphaera haliotis]|uniref:RecBCD enzyme subunit RecB n=1 Tax=Psychrosphaera haliotis TaxID=555083 RepID=A0A6N8F4F0_9GAMM|nr:exodeoxyribonuclease V subunit beta [Psychrosphaera haliotis]MUH71048.1 exodeoxyribonuclease V subunit beta [Psychrosphaera haliotis]